MGRSNVESRRLLAFICGVNLEIIRRVGISNKDFEVPLWTLFYQSSVISSLLFCSTNPG